MRGDDHQPSFGTVKHQRGANLPESNPPGGGMIQVFRNPFGLAPSRMKCRESTTIWDRIPKLQFRHHKVRGSNR